MSVNGAVRISIFASLLILAPSILAQSKSAAVDPQSKPRKIKREPSNAFKVWKDEVDSIITPEELKAWNNLKTDEERERFVDEFWHLRDPDPDTDENEYREAYYERVEYANEHFSSGIKGVKTDRGRVYLKFGKPDEVESHPSGGSYERELSDGGGSTSTYPFERWFYRNLPGRAGASIEFVDPTGTGEYRIARNPFEKDALLMVPGAAPTIDGRSQADYVLASNGVGNPFSGREAESPFSWLDLKGILDSAPPEPTRDPFGDVVGTPRIEDNPLNFETSFGFFKLDDNRVVTTVTVQTDNKELSFNDSGGVQVATVNISGRIINVVGRRVNLFEDAVNTTATSQELIEAKERKAAYQKTLVLSPGHYKADLLVRDIKSGATGYRQIGFTVPKFGESLATSSLILASVLEQVTGETASRQFTIGNQRVIPNISGDFHRGSAVGLYLQIYNAGIDQTTLRPSVDVAYVLLKDGHEVRRQTEDWRGAGMNGDRLTLSRLIDTRGLVAGDYDLEVRIKDQVNAQSLLQKARFKVIP
jgi:GWxTD domain-containing protein